MRDTKYDVLFRNSVAVAFKNLLTPKREDALHRLLKTAIMFSSSRGLDDLELSRDNFTKEVNKLTELYGDRIANDKDATNIVNQLSDYFIKNEIEVALPERLDTPIDKAEIVGEYKTLLIAILSNRKISEEAEFLEGGANELYIISPPPP